MAEPLVRLRAVGLHYGSLPVVAGVTLDIRGGEFVSLIGPSGCGKSTLLRLIAGLVPPDAGGEVRIDRLPPSRRRAGERRLGLMFQKPLLLPWRTALQNVCLPAELSAHGGDRKAARAQAQSLLKLVGLEGFEGHYPHQLSGGMQQRVSLARALSARPQLLLMDEPFGALDEITREAMNEELLRIWRDPAAGLSTVVMVTHSITEAVALSDRIVVMSPRPARVVRVIELRQPRTRDPLGAEYRQVVDTVRGLIRSAR